MPALGSPARHPRCGSWAGGTHARSLYPCYFVLMNASGPSLADPALMLVLDRQRRLSVGDYHRMIEAGILGEDDHVELLEGVMVQMTPQGPRHAKIIQRLCDPTFARVPGEQIVRCQLPLTIGADSEPEPDVSVVHRADGNRLSVACACLLPARSDEPT